MRLLLIISLLLGGCDSNPPARLDVSLLDIGLQDSVASDGSPLSPDQANDTVAAGDTVGPVDMVVPPDQPVADATAGVWKPSPGTTWQWQLTGALDTTVPATMFDIDLFDNSAGVIAGLKAQGKIVICYFSAGSYEAWRPDAEQLPESARGDKMSGWDELWLDIRSAEVRDVMRARLDLASSKGCDGVEPDNVDGYTNKTGFALTAADQLAYNKFLAAEAHQRGLSVGLKNDLDQVIALEPFFDWALNEECLQYNECAMLSPFITAGKAVFHTEYDVSKASVCPKTAPLKLDSLIKHLDLDAWYEACWE